MPNHIQNQIIAPAEVIEALTRGHKPEEIQSYRDETERIREKVLDEWFTAERKEYILKSREARQEEMLTEKIADFALVIPEPENIETGGCSGHHEPGIICWYRWNTENWGTKWNAYETEIEQLDNGLTQLRFQTAWSHPYPVIELLSNRYPDVKTEISYADEDLGHNLDRYEITNGARTHLEDLEFGSNEACDFAAKLHYGKTYAELQKEWEA